MSMRETEIRYKVSIEGAEESLDELQGLLSQTARGIRVVTSLDYTWMSLQRTIKDFDIMNLTRSVLAVINFMHTLISVIRTAQAAHGHRRNWRK